MFSTNFFECFDNFFRLGTSSFFRNNDRSEVSNNSRVFVNRPKWSVAEAIGLRDGNREAVSINHNRLHWYDSNLQRALVPFPDGNPRSMYLSKAELDKLDIRIFDPLTSNIYSTTECDICLAAFKLGNKLKVLPCKHSYHNDCIDKWLLQRPVCPRCRSGVRTGLRRQLADQKKTKTTTRDGFKLDPDIIERRRKINNNYYLKKREKRLNKLKNMNANINDIENKKVEKEDNNVTSTSVPHSSIENNVSDQRQNIMNIARERAVAAAMKRASISLLQS